MLPNITGLNPVVSKSGIIVPLPKGKITMVLESLKGTGYAITAR
jgi:hypothetical protein